MWVETGETSNTISVPEKPTAENIARLILENPSIIASVAFQIGENRALKCFRWWEEVDILTPEMAKRVDAILRDGVSWIGLVHTTVGWWGTPNKPEYVLYWIHGNQKFDAEQLSYQLA